MRSIHHNITKDPIRIIKRTRMLLKLPSNRNAFSKKIEEPFRILNRLEYYQNLWKDLLTS